MKSGIAAIIVTYLPEKVLLDKCIGSISRQVDKVIVVDNTPANMISDWYNLFAEGFNVEWILLNKNCGIAYAQNLGIRMAIDEGVDFIILSDQDTVFPENYTSSMLQFYKSSPRRDRIAAIAPVFRDINKGKIEPRIYFDGVFVKKDYSVKNCICVANVISSGMFVPTNVFKVIGYNNERLFIDWVDTEWCWRAIRKGFEIIQVPDVVINHRLGNFARKVLWKEIPVHTSSIRRYFRLRNAIYLLFFEDLSFGMKLNLIHRIVVMIPLHLVVSKNKEGECLFILTAIRDGLTKRMGGREIDKG
ncbi:MAG TPA: glycosyltransferase family 2 protein [Bacteroidales bacterium]|nr:glycosyltransferase family 2 protein [Bacteroidales bacterium]